MELPILISIIIEMLINPSAMGMGAGKTESLEPASDTIITQALTQLYQILKIRRSDLCAGFIYK